MAEDEFAQYVRKSGKSKPKEEDFSQYARPAANAITPEATGTIAPDSRGAVTRFLDDMESDLRTGGARTLVGKTLGKMQGRGDKGYTGLESGTSKGVADFMGSVPLGATTASQGIAEMKDHPIKGTVKALKGALQMSTIPAAFSGGPVADAAIEAIPSRQAAGELFKSVMADASNVPVSFSRSSGSLLRAKEIADAGTSMPQALGKLLRRATDPNKGPITYAEARDFYTNISSLSANEASRISPVMKRQVGEIAAALRQDIGDAAEQAGRASDYYAAMKEYRQAARLSKAAKEMGKWAMRTAGAGAALEGGKLLWNLRK